MRRSIKRTLLALMAGSGWLVFVGPGAAQTTFTWNNTATDWATGTNWTPTGPPTAADIAQFDPQIGGTSVTNPTLNAAQAVLNLAWANNPQGGNYTLTGNGNTLTFGASSGATVSAVAMTFRGSAPPRSTTPTWCSAAPTLARPAANPPRPSARWTSAPGRRCG